MDKQPRILVTGTGGQLGHGVCLELKRRGIECLGTASSDMDITDREAVCRTVREYGPDAAVHCAAYTKDLAPLLCDLVRTKQYGTYHAANEGTCSWSEFAKAIFQESGCRVSVEEILSAEYNSAKAVRPLNSRLSKQSLEEAGLARLPHWRDALTRYLKPGLTAEAKDANR